MTLDMAKVRADVSIRGMDIGLFRTGWPLEGWNYRRKVTITEQSGNDLTDFQVLVSLDSSNFNFAHAQSNGEDVRFTDAEGNLLSYWIEEWDAANEKAKVWVKVPSIPANSSVEIYMYYGNPSASSESDASATFIRIIDGLVGSWHLDEGSGTTAYDSSGNDNDGTIYGGATWVDGKFGKALNFDGSDDYVNCGNNFVLEDFTICWWEYPTELASGEFYSPICRYYKDGPVFQHEYEGEILTMYKKDGDSYQELAWGGVGISINQWYFIAVTFKSSTRVAELYVNGTSKGTLTFNDGTFDNTHDFIIGARVPPGWRYFKGIIDEVLVLTKTLSVEEILDLYNNYGYTTENYPGKVLVCKYTEPEPSVSVGGEETP